MSSRSWVAYARDRELMDQAAGRPPRRLGGRPLIARSLEADE